MPHLVEDEMITLLEGDVRDFTFPSGDFEFVIHGATSTSLEAASRPIELMETLVHGTERMLAFAKASRARSFLFLSSGAVYGSQPESLSHIHEDYLGGPAWLDPRSVYGEGKRIAEQLCAITAKECGMQLAIARCFAFVGAHLPLDQHFAIGNFIGDALANRNISIRGDGTPMRSYLYAADLAVWLWTLLLHKSQTNEDPVVVNVGSGDAISIRDLAREVVSELNPSLTVEVARQPTPGARRDQYVPDVRKAQAVLDLRPVIGLKEAIRRTAAWYSKDR
jgi:dTDP-glucose 4,6-dehydratase